MEENRVLLKQGAEARLYMCSFLGRNAIVKERCRKRYRLKILDDMLTKERTKAELRSLLRCKQIGVCCPGIYFVDIEKACIIMEHIPSITIRQYIQQVQNNGDNTDSLLLLIRIIGRSIAKMHSNNIIHGDLTTSNMLLYRHAEETTVKNEDAVYFIDFGLSYVERNPEHKGVDLYVLERAFISTHPNSEDLFQQLLESYKKSYKSSKEVIRKLDEVRMRGRKRTMVG